MDNMPLRHHFEFRETIATIVADRPEDIDAACSGLAQARQEVERYISFDPFFQSSFEPLPVCTDNEMISRMAQAAERATVGPMAAVAGAVADFALGQVIGQGAEFCIIDNGGDIALITDRDILIGLYAGDSPFSGKYAFRIAPTKGRYGICTSSATVGHSISLGIADSVTVFGPDPILADAMATAICNEVTLDDHSCLERIGPDIDGIFAVIGDTSIAWGSVPPLVRASVQEELITVGGLPLKRISKTCAD